MSSQTSPTYIIGIGASAGGLEALDNFFHAMPVDSGMAFVVIQHLSPDFKSMMAEQLARYTSLPIMSVQERERVLANTVYLLPPKKDMVLEGDELICTDRPNDRVLSLPINGFFRSLANAAGDKAIAIVLSGTGSDGSAGVMDVYEGGGLVLVQSIDSARLMVCRAVQSLQGALILFSVQTQCLPHLRFTRKIQTLRLSLA